MIIFREDKGVSFAFAYERNQATGDGLSATFFYIVTIKLCNKQNVYYGVKLQN